MLGILLVDKPRGITSHDVVARVRKMLGVKRVGHAGTLDPLATGALVVAVGPATRFLQYLPLEPKVYEFTVKFGVETTTQDAEGEIVAQNPVPDDLLQRLLKVMPDCVGEIDQLPPMHSAVKKDGKPLYALARMGLEVERDTRTVHIDELTLIEVSHDVGKFACICSGGTYVRTLAHDLGQTVGCGAHVTELRRTAVGKFHIRDAIILENVTPEALIPLSEALKPMEVVQIDATQADEIWHGMKVAVRPAPKGKFVALQDPLGRVISVAEVTPHGFLQPACVIPMEALGGPV